jgi:hypothetical protein
MIQDRGLPAQEIEDPLLGDVGEGHGGFGRRYHATKMPAMSAISLTIRPRRNW